MYRFADLGNVWAQVKLPYQDDDGEDISIQLLFRVFTDEELDERERSAMLQTARRLQRDVAERMQSAKGRAGEAAPPAPISVDDLEEMFDASTRVRDSDRAEVLERACDWRGVAGEGGEPIDFDRDKLAAMLAHRPIFHAARDALYRVSREGVAKNSEPGAAGSRAVLQA